MLGRAIERVQDRSLALVAHKMGTFTNLHPLHYTEKILHLVTIKALRKQISNLP